MQSQYDVVLEFKHTSKSEPIEFLGYHFEREEKSKVSGAKAIHYFDDQPEVWKVPFYPELSSSLTVQAPKLGYFVPPAQAAWMKKKLDLHQIHYEVNQKEAPVDLEALCLPKGTLFTPIHQPNARLMLTLFEPLSKDSFLSWGFFNQAFERKEYMEDYVAEELGTQMLKDPKIKDAFEARLKNEPEFEKSPKLRFEFFYKLHPSWDQTYNRYPIYRS